MSLTGGDPPPLMRGRDRARSRLATVAIVGVTWLAVVIALWPAHGKLLAWDEVNYATAAKAGIVANAVERGSLSPVDWVRFAFAKQMGIAPSLPAGYDEANDPLLLRFHPPFVDYLIAAIAGDQTPIDERRVRAAQLLGALALIAVVTAAYRSLSATPTLMGSAIVALLSGWVSVQLFALISLHGWFAVWTVVTAILLARWLESGTTRGAVALGCGLGAALVTLESAALLWLLVVAIFLVRRWAVAASRGTWRQLVLALAVAAAFVVVAWPGTVVSISLVKLAATLVYRVRLGQDYVDVALSLPRVAAAFLPTLVLVPLGAAALWRMGAPRRQWRLYAVLCAVYAAAFARFALQPEYVGPASAVAVPIIGLAADRVGRWPRAAFAAIALAIVVATVPAWWPEPREDPSRADIDSLRGPLRGRSALVDGGHIVRYYLGPTYDVRSVSESHDRSVLQIRRNGQYEDLGRPGIAGKVVVLRVRPGGESRIERELLAGCAREDRPTIRLYDCASVSTVSRPPID